MPSVALKNRHANIFLAASDNDLASVTQFLDLGVPVNELDGNGYSTLHAASSYNHFDLLRFLVARGGNVNLPDHEGETPIFVAETREMCALLIELGADAGRVNAEGQTVLERFVEEGEFPDVIAFLGSIHPGMEGNPTVSLPRRQGTAGPRGGIDVRYEHDHAGQGDHFGRDGGLQAGAAGQQQAAGIGGGDEIAAADGGMMDGLPLEVRQKVMQLISDSARDGIDRDDELRRILTEALTGSDLVDAAGNARQRTE